VSVLGVQRPAQIVDYRSVGSTPVYLAAALALGAIVALALTLVYRYVADAAIWPCSKHSASPATTRPGRRVASDRHRTRGSNSGRALGILIGRQLWTLFARSINAVPDPTVPTSR